MRERANKFLADLTFRQSNPGQRLLPVIERQRSYRHEAHTEIKAKEIDDQIKTVELHRWFNRSSNREAFAQSGCPLQSATNSEKKSAARLGRLWYWYILCKHACVTSCFHYPNGG